MADTILTGKRRLILEFISDQIRSKGYPPSVREIGEAVGLTSSSTVHTHLQVLQRQGYLRRDPSKPRAIAVSFEPASGAAIPLRPVAHVPLLGDVAAGTGVLAEESVEEMPYKKLLLASEEAKAVQIKGVTGIRRALIRKEKDEYVIYTEGSNLEGVIEIPGVDGVRTTTNSVFEIYRVYGVEAARAALIHEANRTLAEQGLGVDIRHLMLVADVMTNEGDIRAIGRHGISGKKSSVLARAAFEITAAHLLRAAITGEVDELKGVAENIIVGQPITLGTGAVNLVYRPLGAVPAAKPEEAKEAA